MGFGLTLALVVASETRGEALEGGRKEKEGGMAQSTQSLARKPPHQKRTKHAPHPHPKRKNGRGGQATQRFPHTKTGPLPQGTMDLPSSISFFKGKGGIAKGQADIIAVHLPQRELRITRKPVNIKFLNLYWSDTSYPSWTLLNSPSCSFVFPGKCSLSRSFSHLIFLSSFSFYQLPLLLPPLCLPLPPFVSCLVAVAVAVAAWHLSATLALRWARKWAMNAAHQLIGRVLLKFPAACCCSPTLPQVEWAAALCHSTEFWKGVSWHQAQTPAAFGGVGVSTSFVPHIGGGHRCPP